MVDGGWNKAGPIRRPLFAIHGPLPSALGAAHRGFEEARGVEQEESSSFVFELDVRARPRLVLRGGRGVERAFERVRGERELFVSAQRDEEAGRRVGRTRFA